MAGTGSSAAKLQVAVVQLNATEDLAHNLRVADRLTREAAARGAEFVVLPEKWAQLGHGEVMARDACALDRDPAIQWAVHAAAELRLDLLAGSVVERRAGYAKTFNTSVHITPDGEISAVYRKLHLFDVEVAGVGYAESRHEQAGEEVATSTLAHGAHRLGMSICYDLRFPELYRALSDRGAELLAVPAAFTLATTRDHWEVLLRARAIENQCFVVAANQVGCHAPGRQSGGRSMIVDPWGIVLAAAPDQEGVTVAQLDFAKLAEIRQRLPALDHRRAPDLYAQRAGVEAPV